MKKAVEYFLIFVALQFVSLTLTNGALLLTGRNVEEEIAATALGMNLANFILVVAVFVLWLKTIRPSTQYINKSPVLQMLSCVLLGASLIVPSAIMQQIMPEASESTEKMFAELISSPMGAVAIVLLTPVAEEIVFRGAIIKALNSSFTNKALVIIVSAVLFAIAHFNPAQFAHAFLMGVLLGWLSIRTGSILPCILIHVVNNGLVFVMMRFYPEFSLTSLPLAVVSVLVAVLSLWGVVKFDKTVLHDKVR